MEIEKKFQELHEKKEGAYMAHVYYGDPSEEFSLRQIDTLVKNGADFIEFGIPFSDPTADGTIFQAACERALKNGITPPKCIQGIKKLRENLEIPIVVTTYYNIPYIAGVTAFLSEIKKAGAQAIIIPDIPFEEASSLLDTGKKVGIDIIFQVTPLTTEDRLREIAAVASGFLYVVNVEGVTGARESLADSTLNLVRRVRKHSNIPIMAGFGISKKEHAATVVSAGADGVIVGSAIGEIYEKNLEHPEETLPQIALFARQIKQGCVGGYIQRLNSSLERA